MRERDEMSVVGEVSVCDVICCVASRTMNLNQFMVALLRADESCVSKHHRSVKQSAANSTADIIAGRDDREELHTAFHVFDANSDGFIDATELRAAMRELTGDVLTDDDVNAMIRSADRDGDGLINYEGKFLIRFSLCRLVSVQNHLSLSHTSREGGMSQPRLTPERTTYIEGRILVYIYRKNDLLVKNLL